jgi:DNA-directed RNA polymerase sigma subunit (sigma70/sigma32)
MIRDHSRYDFRRECRVFQRRFGSVVARRMVTLKEGAKRFAAKRERVRYIGAKALPKLRRPTRTRGCKTYSE